MLECKVHGALDLRVGTAPVPEPGPGEVLLRLGAWPMLPWLRVWVLSQQTINLAEPWFRHTLPTVLGRGAGGRVRCVYWPALMTRSTSSLAPVTTATL